MHQHRASPCMFSLFDRTMFNRLQLHTFSNSFLVIMYGRLKFPLWLILRISCVVSKNEVVVFKFKLFSMGSLSVLFDGSSVLYG
ncbi:hypothetical protein RJT34_15441 [Clitoria ternatea]|uniref:Uncharacterized protein n=1 Tax=Clitoria ternatea TaxID=43366 RepID=A0AAN9J5F2_CLITE